MATKYIFLSTLEVLIEAENEFLACDLISACLTENLEMNHEGFLDWGYLEENGEFQHPTVTETDAQYRAVIQVAVIAESEFEAMEILIGAFTEDLLAYGVIDSWEYIKTPIETSIPLEDYTEGKAFGY